MLCSGFNLVNAGHAHRRYMEPCFIIISQYSTSWAYTRNREPHQHIHTTELVGSTKIPSRGFPNAYPEKQTPSTCNLYRMLLVGECPCIPRFHMPPPRTPRAMVRVEAVGQIKK